MGADLPPDVSLTDPVYISASRLVSSLLLDGDNRRSTEPTISAADGFLFESVVSIVVYMNGNNPYAGAPGVTSPGQSPKEVDLSSEQESALRSAVAGIVSRTESYLPDSYAVGSELSQGMNGPEATVAVNPPAGRPVSAGFSPDLEELETGVDEADHDEVAKGLAASAALQTMAAVGDDFTPTAK